MRGKIHTAMLIITELLFILLIFSLLVSAQHQSVVMTNREENMVIITPIDIQSKIDQAQPYDTIRLAPGSYDQTIIIRKPLTLSGSHPKKTVIHTTSPQNQAAITVASSYVRIENISITNDGPGLYTSGIRILSNHTTIDHCIIEDTPVGIALWTSLNTISNCLFLNCDDEGIVLLDTSYSPCQYNSIINCTFLYNCDGIELQQSSYNIIYNCTMRFNTHSGIDAIRNNNDYNLISNCVICDNKVHGIYFAGSSNNRIISCCIENNTDGNIIYYPVTTESNLSSEVPSESILSYHLNNKNNQAYLVEIILNRLNHIRSIVVSTLQTLRER
jgi:parallel beta-helix repeat protein